MRFKRSRGQVLIITALAIALAILSTQIYIYQIEKNEASADLSSLGDYVLSIEQGSRHVVIASLLNISSGGAISNLLENLKRWEEFVGADYHFGSCNINATPSSQPPYQDGVVLNWEVEGMGVTGAYAVFILNVSGRGAEVNWSYITNITTMAMVSGSYTRVLGNLTQVTVFLNLLNEGEPALSGNTTLSYRINGDWKNPVELESYSLLDFGNGTYRFSFTDTIPGNQVQVRVEAYDLRNIFVRAEATLGEV